MKKYYLLCFLLICSFYQGFTQISLQGVVFDSLNNKPLSQVSIENLQSHQGCVSKADGSFIIEAKLDDYIVFTYVGYTRKVVLFHTLNQVNRFNVMLSPKTTYLKPVTINRGPTEYQKDSANRAELYQDVFLYEQQKSAFTPISSIYQKFSKKYKNLRKFQGQIKDIEEQKFIDTRYTPELVYQLTKLQDEGLASFINQYPMEYDYARVASELEIKMWVKYNFQDYIKKGKPAYVPGEKKKPFE